MVERIVISLTTIQFSRTSLALPSAIPAADWHSIRFNFWLVPLKTEMSNILVSVVDVFPVHLWDRRSHQFIWIPSKLENLDPETRYDPFTAGVARINLSPVISEDTEHGSKRGPTAVLRFGRRFSKPVPALGSGPRRPDFSANPAWCLLDKDDENSSLDQHCTAPITIQDARRHSSLALGGGVMLHASTVRTLVARKLSDFVKIWTTVSDTGRDADGVMTNIGILAKL